MIAAPPTVPTEPVIADRDEVHVWLHQIALHHRGLVDAAEAVRKGRDNTASDALFAHFRAIAELHHERHPECRATGMAVPGSLWAADEAYARGDYPGFARAVMAVMAEADRPAEGSEP